MRHAELALRRVAAGGLYTMVLTNQNINEQMIHNWSSQVLVTAWFETIFKKMYGCAGFLEARAGNSGWSIDLTCGKPGKRRGANCFSTQRRKDAKNAKAAKREACRLISHSRNTSKEFRLELFHFLRVRHNEFPNMRFDIHHRAMGSAKREIVMIVEAVDLKFLLGC